MSRSALYEGWVMHRRLRPKLHRFKYRVFSLLLDLDDLPRLDRSLRLFAWNRGGLFSFHDRDHGPAGNKDLRGWVDTQLEAAGIAPGGPKRVLCYPRILGYTFNPLSVWFCDDENGAPKAIIYEVHNTYDEGHCYVFPVSQNAVPGTGLPEHRPGDARPEDDLANGDGPSRAARPCDQKISRHDCAKNFYVSPFLSKDHRYHFRIAAPGEKVAVAINETQGHDTILNASFAGSRRTLTDAALLSAFFRYPLMTLKVVAAIHYEAVRLMLKGIRRHAHAKLAESGTWSRNLR